MQTRRLGSLGLEVSAIGLGCLSLVGSYGGAGSIGTAAARALVDQAIEQGITFFDTAAMYGPSEDLLGAAIRGRHEGLVIATKFGVLLDERGRPVGMDARPAAVKADCDASLKRLGIATIDLFYLHRLDRAVPIEDTVGAMADLVRAGKVRHLGLCEVSARTLRRAQAVHPISALQSEYSLWSRDIEATILPCCRELGIGCVPFSPLGRGFLTGTLAGVDGLAPNDPRRGTPRFEPGNFARNQRLLEILDHVAGRHGVTPAQVSLAWLLHQGPDIVPIPGTKSPGYLKQNAAAASLRLTSEDLDILNSGFAPDQVAGDRYGEASRRFIDTD